LPIILRNIKKLGNFRKSARKCAPDDLFTFASDDVIPGEQTREQAIEVLNEHYTTHTHNDVEIGSGKINFLSNLNNA